uniref:Putative ras-domain-containing protein n=1 Tax=Moniliophthora roreri TaxID=221103 RepID=A0A0W0FPB0_MONRR
MAGISWNYVFKFIITGDAAVGKSSLLVRLTDQRFLANPDPTLGVEFGSKLLTIPEENKVIKLQCFMNARSWLADVREHADPHLTCILVGNKVDLCEPESEPGEGAAASGDASAAQSTIKRRRQVSTEEAELFAKEEGLLFVESSAKSGQNVEKAFEDAARDILDKIHRGVFDDDRASLILYSDPSIRYLLLAGVSSHAYVVNGIPPVLRDLHFSIAANAAITCPTHLPVLFICTLP